MRLRLLLAFLLLSPLAAFSQTYFGVNGWCTVGAQATVTQGLSSSGTKPISGGAFSQSSGVLASYPKCTITVYATGTTNISVIYSNVSGNGLSNPFTGATDGSFLFFAVAGCYDVVTSSGVTTGSTMPQSKTYTDVCVGGSGGGGGTIGPGTVNQIAKFVSVNNVGDSSGSDDGTNFVQWPNGLTSMGSAYGKLYPNSPNGTTANYLGCIDSTITSVAEVTTCPASTTKAIGIVHLNSAGTTGNAQIAMLGFDSCIFDNQTSIGDYVGPSSTTAGQCSDLGSTRPASVQGVGRVTTLNAGAGTSAIIDLGPWDLFAPGSTGAGQCAFDNAVAYFLSGSLLCDQQFTDDGAGHAGLLSLQFNDPTYAMYVFYKQGALPPATPANTIMEAAPTSVTTQTIVKAGGTASVGQTQVVDTTATDANGHPIYRMKWGTAGGGVEAQTNGVDNANCSGGVCPLVNLQNGTGTTVTNPSGGIWQVNIASAPQISTPTAPTLTTNGSAGSTQYCYKVVGLQDGPTGGYHTAASAQTCIATGNATLTSSNSINVKAFGDTLYGPRCYNIYRTSSAGTPSTTGLIANCVWKAFIDTGLAGDSSTAPTTNTTQLDSLGLTDVVNPCNRVPAAPWAIDGLPCTPNAMDDEFTYTFQIGGINDGFWTPINTNTNSFVGTLTNGLVSMTSATQGSAFSIHCYFQTLASGSYTVLAYPHTDLATGYNWFFYMALRESGTGKILGWGQQTQNGGTTRLTAARYTNTTTLASQPFNVGFLSVGTANYPEYLGIKWDLTDLFFYDSTTGVTYKQEYTEAKTASFTTAPDQIGVCIDNYLGANIVEFDNFRKRVTALP